MVVIGWDWSSGCKGAGGGDGWGGGEGRIINADVGGNRHALKAGGIGTSPGNFSKRGRKADNGETSKETVGGGL